MDHTVYKRLPATYARKLMILKSRSFRRVARLSLRSLQRRAGNLPTQARIYHVPSWSVHQACRLAVLQSGHPNSTRPEPQSSARLNAGEDFAANDGIRSVPLDAGCLGNGTDHGELLGCQGKFRCLHEILKRNESL